jgi:Ser/Thr protein kinase RdoA (MazF antagonist)
MVRDREQGLRVGRAGAERFGLEPDSLRLIHDSPEGDGFVYEAERGGRPAILKVGLTDEERLPGARAKAEFVAYLGGRGAQVATPYHSSGGLLVETIPDGDALLTLTAYPKASGHPLDSADPRQCTAEVREQWGRVLGRFHALAQEYPHGYRPCPAGEPPPTDSPCPVDDWRSEHAFFATWDVDEEVKGLWRAIGDALAALPQPRDGFGLIHNDMHSHNMILGEGRLTVIDFDVTAYHWFVSDIATGLHSHLVFGFSNRPEEWDAAAAAFLRPLVAGYRAENTLGAEWWERLPLFLTYRDLLLHIVFSGVWGPEAPESQRAFLARQRQRVTSGRPLVNLPSLP